MPSGYSPAEAAASTAWTPAAKPFRSVSVKWPRQEAMMLLPSMVYELLDQQKSYFKDLMDQQEKSFKACLQVFVDSTVSRVDNLVRDVAIMSRNVDDLKASLQFSQAEIDGLKISNAKCMEDGKTIAEGLLAFQTLSTDVTAKLDYLENQSRRSNVIIDGIPDVKSESWSDAEIKVKNVFTDHLKINPKLIEIERAHRVGKYDPTGRPRSIVAKLLRFKDKEEIFKRSKNLKGTNIYINEDYSESVRQKRKDLLPQLKAERQKGNIAYLKFDKLVVHPPRDT